jgi:hypothetical protein
VYITPQLNARCEQCQGLPLLLGLIQKACTIVHTNVGTFLHCQPVFVCHSVSPLKIVKNGIICKNINSTTQKIHLAFDLERTIHILKYFQRP